MSSTFLNTEWCNTLNGHQIEAELKSQLLAILGDIDNIKTTLEDNLSPQINISDIDVLGGDYNYETYAKEKSKLYNVVNDAGECIGKLILMSWGGEYLVQIMFAPSNPNSKTSMFNPSLFYRFLTRNSTPDIISYTWSEWNSLTTPYIYENQLDIMINDGASFMSYILQRTNTFYNVISSDGKNIGSLMMFTDTMSHCVVQYLTSFYTPDMPPGYGSHSQKPTCMYRVWDLTGIHGPSQAWSDWRNVWEDQLQAYLQKNSLTKVLDNTTITQNIGNKQDKVMAQNAVTSALNAICEYLGLTLMQDSDGEFHVLGNILASRVNLSVNNATLRNICVKADIPYTENTSTGEITIL